jgi:hypothetical protein
MPEVYLRGNTIKYLRVPDEVLDKAKEESFKRDGGWGQLLRILPLHCVTACCSFYDFSCMVKVEVDA